jgi:hypothetical protein
MLEPDNVTAAMVPLAAIFGRPRLGVEEALEAVVEAVLVVVDPHAVNNTPPNNTPNTTKILRFKGCSFPTIQTAGRLLERVELLEQPDRHQTRD